MKREPPMADDSPRVDNEPIFQERRLGGLERRRQGLYSQAPSLGSGTASGVSIEAAVGGNAAVLNNLSVEMPAGVKVDARTAETIRALLQKATGTAETVPVLVAPQSRAACSS